MAKEYGTVGNLVVQVSQKLEAKNYKVFKKGTCVVGQKCPKCGRRAVVSGHKFTPKCLFQAWVCAHTDCDYSIMTRKRK